MIYNYTKEVNLDVLDRDIRNSSITVAISSINVNGTDVEIVFKAALSASEEIILDDIVANHDNTQIVYKEPEIDEDGRQIIRTAYTNKGWHYQAHSVEFTTSTLNSCYNKDKNGVDLGYAEIKLYDSIGDEITDQSVADTDCVKSVITWKPDFDFEIISENIRQESRGAFDMYLYTGLQVQTGYPAPYNLFYVPFTNGGINMKYIGADEPLKTDGRSSKYVKAATNGDYFEITLNHGAGNKHSMSIIFEIYKSPT